MTTGLVMSITDELVAELEALAGKATPGPWGYDGSYVCTVRNDGETVYVQSWDPVADALLSKNVHYIASANPATILALLAERAELRRVIADVKWRVTDTTDQLQTTGFDGDRRYGLDEWSGPIKNLNMAIGILEKALEPKT